MTSIASRAQIALLALFLGACSEAERPVAETPVEAGDDWAGQIDEVFAPWDDPSTPGVAVAVIRDGEIVFERGYGSAQLEYGVDITPETAYHVASVSKQFTTMAVAMLAQEGKLSLDDDVRQHLPWLPDYGSTITIRQLAHHTSGLPELLTLLELGGWRDADLVSLEQARAIVARQRGLNFEPGSRFEYSNSGYVLLAEVVSAVSGQPFSEFTRERIFEPLGMERSHFYDDHRKIVPGRAYSYHGGDAGRFNKAVMTFGYVGSTGLFSTARDLALWLDNFRHSRAGGPAAIEQLRERVELNDGTTLDMAFGVGLGNYRGVDVIAHNGADAGFRSYVAWYEQPAVGIVVLSNVGTVVPSALAVQVADIVMAEDFPEPPPGGDTAAPAMPATAPDPSRYAEYVGQYRLATGPLLVVSLEDGRLRARAGTNEDDMQPVAEDEFLLPAFNAPIRFERLEDGQVDGFVLVLGGDPIEGTRVEGTEDMPTAATLMEYAGTYYSDEVGSVYTIDVVQDRLQVSNLRRGQSPATYVGADEFISNLLPSMAFERDADGRVTSLVVGARHVTALRFEKLR